MGHEKPQMTNLVQQSCHTALSRNPAALTSDLASIFVPVGVVPMCMTALAAFVFTPRICQQFSYVISAF